MEENTDKVIKLENRVLQSLLVATVSVLSFFLVSMYDRFNDDFAELDSDIQIIEDKNSQRDHRLAVLMLEIESRISRLEARSDG